MEGWGGGSGDVMGPSVIAASRAMTIILHACMPVLDVFKSIYIIKHKHKHIKHKHIKHNSYDLHVPVYMLDAQISVCHRCHYGSQCEVSKSPSCIVHLMH